MKQTFFLFFMLLFVTTFSQKTLKDVLSKNTSYAEKIYEIDNDTSIIGNSDTATIKRYNRWRAYLDFKVDSLGSLNSYINCVAGLLADTSNAKSFPKSYSPLSFYQIGPFEADMVDKNYIGRADVIKLKPDDLLKKTVYVGSNSGGLFKTDDIYADPPLWTSLTDNWSGTGTLDMAIDPVETNIMYLANSYRIWNVYGPIEEHGLGVLKTVDGGEDWTIQPLPYLSGENEHISIKGIKLDPNNRNRLFAVGQKRLYISEDKGETWVFKELPGNYYTNYFNVSISTGYPTGIFVYGKNGMCYSSDMGNTWRDLYYEKKMLKYVNFITEHNCRNSINYADWIESSTELKREEPLYSSENFTGVFNTKEGLKEMIFSDNGKIFYKYPSQGTGTSVRDLGSGIKINSADNLLKSLANAKDFICVGDDGYVISYSSPTTFSDEHIHNSGLLYDFRKIVFQPSHIDVSSTIKTVKGFIIASTNKLIPVDATYNTISDNIDLVFGSEISFPEYINDIQYIGNNRVIIVCNNGVMYKSDDYGNPGTWNQLVLTSSNPLYPNPDLLCLTENNIINNLVFISCSNGIVFKISNSESTFNISDVSPSSIIAANKKLYCIDFESIYYYGKIITAGEGGKMIFSDDYGLTWTLVESGQTEDIKFIGFPFKKEITEFNSSVDYKQSENKFYVLTNGTDYSFNGINLNTASIEPADGSLSVQLFVAKIKFNSSGDRCLGGIKLYDSEKNQCYTGPYCHADIRDIEFIDNDRYLVANDGGVLLVDQTLGSDLSSCFTNKSGNLCFFQSPNIGLAQSSNQILGCGGSDVGGWVLNSNTGIWSHSLDSDGGNIEINNNASIKAGVNGCSVIGSQIFSPTNVILAASSINLRTPIKMHPARMNELYYEKNPNNSINRKLMKGVYDSGTLTEVEIGNINGYLSDIDISSVNPDRLIYISYSPYPDWISNGIYLQPENLTEPFVKVETKGNPSNPYVCDFLPDEAVVDIDLHPIEEFHFWIAFSNFGSEKLYYYHGDDWTSSSLKNNNNWTNLTYNLNDLEYVDNVPLNCIEYDQNNDVLYAGTEFGLYYLQGSYWYLDDGTLGHKLPRLHIQDLDIHETTNELFIATWGRGLWKAQLPCNDPVSTTEIWGNQIWTDDRTICGSLEIEEDVVLTTESINMYDGSSITLMPNSTLHLNGEISNAMDGNWNGEIIVQSGAELYLEDGSAISLKETGKIHIQDGGKLYYGDCVITLADNDTKLQVTGDLHINANSDFSFTGNGYLKFDNTDAESRNITCDENASITLSGTGITDKVLEVDQETFYGPSSSYGPEDLTSFTISNAKIEMGSNARIQFAVPTAISFTNTKLTSTTGTNNGHRGLYLYGQSSVTINNCDFEYGSKGIYAYLQYGGNNLSISNSDFSNCDFGLWSLTKGVNLTGCTFTDCVVGWYTENMDYMSTAEECQFNSNNWGIWFVGSSTSDFTLNDCNVDYNSQYGVVADGGMMTTIYCGTVKNNVGPGMHMQNNALLEISSYYNPNSGKVDMSGNDITISCYPSGGLFLKAGKNNLAPVIGGANGKVAMGQINIPCSNLVIDAKNNKWHTSNWLSPVNGTDYILNSTACRPPNTITLKDLSPAAASCMLLKGGSSDLTSLSSFGSFAPSFFGNINSEHFDNMPFNSAFFNAYNNSSFMADGSNDLESIEKFYEILNFTYSTFGFRHEMQKLGYNYMNALLGRAYKNGLLVNNGILSEQGTKIIEIQDLLLNSIEESELSALDEITPEYLNRLYLTIDKSNIYRISGKYSEAIALLSDALSWTLTDDDHDLVTHWICTNEIERMIKNGELEPGEEENIMLECSGGTAKKMAAMIMNSATQFQKLTDVEDNNYILKIEPNPVNSISGITSVIESDYSNGKIEIYNNIGEIIKTFEISGSFNQKFVDRINFVPGIYWVVLEVDGVKVKSEKMIIIK